MSLRGRLVPRTLRARVSALSALIVLVVLVATAGLLVVVQRAALLEGLDDTLDRQVEVVVGELRAGRSVDEQDLVTDDVVVEIVGPDGGRRTVPADAVGDGDDDPVREVARQVDGTTVRALGDLEDVDESVGALLTALAVGVPLATAVLAGILWWTVGRALRPVEEIRRRVDAISGARLDRRVPEPAEPIEMARLARTMNAMLQRLQASAEEQRRFVADASHELRSPLARMRAELEVDVAHPESADPGATAASTLAETVGLQRLVDDLLLLARGDAGALAPEPVLLDLDDVVTGCVRRAAAGATVDATDVRPVQVRGDRVQLERLVDNLLDNAVRHARSRVTVALGERSDGTAVLVVTDDGPGIAPADRERVFERFTRLDEARSAGVGGAGLGLSIARDVAERHGGSLVAEPAAAGARFVLILPVAGIT